MKIRAVSLLITLCIVMTLASVGVSANAAATVNSEAWFDADFEELIREQFTAYVQGLDMAFTAAGKTAPNEALNAMVSAALVGTVGLDVKEDHAMTVTVLNSELYMKTAPEAIAAAIEQMQMTHKDVMYLRGTAGWYDFRMSHSLSAYQTDDEDDEDGRIGSVYHVTDLKLTENRSNDMVLKFVGGSTRSRMNIELDYQNSTDETRVYCVQMRLFDSFDFNNNYDRFDEEGYDTSTAKLLTELGNALGLKTFEWAVNAEFTVSVPNKEICNHGLGAYSWIYDHSAGTMTSVADDRFEENSATQYLYITEDDDGETITTPYYKLDYAAELFYDRPWTVEMTVQGRGNLVLASAAGISCGLPFFVRTYALRNQGSENSYYEQFLWGGHYSARALTEEEQKEMGTTEKTVYWRDYYGVDYTSIFNANKGKNLTLRLENVVNEDGTNMVYAYVGLPDSKGEMEWTRCGPMINHYLTDQNVSGENQNDTGDWLSNKDIYIRFIGNQSYRLNKSTKSVRIWENGKGNEDRSYLNPVVVEPTATTEGYTIYKCPYCGETFKGDYVDPHAHEYETFAFDWTGSSAVTVSSDCAECGHTEKKDCTITYSTGDGRISMTAKAAFGETEVRETKHISTAKNEKGFSVTVPEISPGAQVIVASYSDDRMGELKLFDKNSDGSVVHVSGKRAKVIVVDAESKIPLCAALEQ